MAQQKHLMNGYAGFFLKVLVIVAAVIGTYYATISGIQSEIGIIETRLSFMENEISSLTNDLEGIRSGNKQVYDKMLQLIKSMDSVIIVMQVKP